MSNPVAPKPDFTAFIVALIVSAVHCRPKWRVLVDGKSFRFYEACTAACARRSLLMRLLRLLPVSVRLRLFDSITAFGYSLHLALRKQAIEVQARADIKKGVIQLVIIGAGFDALASRLAREFSEVRFYELDMAVTQAVKRSAIGELPPNMHLIPCNLSKTSLHDALQDAVEFERSVPTLYIAEGLSMYLTESENRAWLADVRRLSGDEARLLITALEAPMAANRFRWLREVVLHKNHSLFKWFIPRERMPEFLEECGFVLKFRRYFDELQTTHRSASEKALLGMRTGDHVYYAAARMQGSNP